MPRRLSLPRPGYAEITATLALVVAMSGTAYAATIAPPGSVNTAALQDGAVTTPKLASEAVSHAKIAPAAVTGADVADHALTLADLAGTNLTGSISFTLLAHRCGNLTLGVAGAKVGQAAVLSWVGTSSPPQGVVLGPLKVVAAGSIVTNACNMTGSDISASGVRVRVITLS